MMWEGEEGEEEEHEVLWRDFLSALQCSGGDSLQQPPPPRVRLEVGSEQRVVVEAAAEPLLWIDELAAVCMVRSADVRGVRKAGDVGAVLKPVVRELAQRAGVSLVAMLLAPVEHGAIPEPMLNVLDRHVHTTLTPQGVRGLLFDAADVQLQLEHLREGAATQIGGVLHPAAPEDVRAYFDVLGQDGTPREACIIGVDDIAVRWIHRVPDDFVLHPFRCALTGTTVVDVRRVVV